MNMERVSTVSGDPKGGSSLLFPPPTEKKMACVQLLCPLIFTHSSYVLAAEMSTSKAQLMGQKSTLSEIGFGIKSEQSTVSSGLEAEPYISLSD